MLEIYCMRCISFSTGALEDGNMPSIIIMSPTCWKKCGITTPTAFGLDGVSFLAWRYNMAYFKRDITQALLAVLNYLKSFPQQDSFRA
jgi:hypothetical protein